ncbi:MAG TPA: hypothetical protein VNG33_07825, partial [Polyangiaceae bacterium]|nr:hypothetical protein [Polyangiaceae bacterium]
PSYEAETASALMAMIAADPPTPLRQRRPDAPPELETTIFRCLEKDRARRLPNVAELARAIAPFAAPEARTSVERIARVLGEAAGPQSMPEASYQPGVAVQPAGAGTAGAWGQTQSRSRGSKGVVAAVLALLVLAAGAGFILWLFERSRSVAPAEHAAVAPSSTSEPLTTALAPAPGATGQAPGAVAEVPAVAGSSSAAPPVPSAAPVAAPSAAAPSKVAVPPLRLKNRAGAARPAANPDLFDDNK